jgi:hypothetical protein
MHPPSLASPFSTLNFFPSLLRLSADPISCTSIFSPVISTSFDTEREDLLQNVTKLLADVVPFDISVSDCWSLPCGKFSNPTPELSLVPVILGARNARSDWPTAPFVCKVCPVMWVGTSLFLLASPTAVSFHHPSYSSTSIDSIDYTYILPKILSKLSARGIVAIEVLHRS